MVQVFIEVFISQVELPDELQPRRGHTLTAVSLAPGLTEVTMFGGSPKWDPTGIDEKQPKLADTVLLRLGEWRQLCVRTH